MNKRIKIKLITKLTNYLIINLTLKVLQLTNKIFKNKKYKKILLYICI